MRKDIYIDEVLAKCEALKKSGIWPAEPILRPRAWLRNFEATDQYIAAVLLDKFNFYNEKLTDRLLISSYTSISDGLPKGPQASPGEILISAIANSLFTLVEGEHPNVTDSGYNFCRRARQVLRINENLIVTPIKALEHAVQGGAVVFLDDFIGSGDQFIKTWNRKISRTSPESFNDAQSIVNFEAIYLTLVATSYGLERIHNEVPTVAVCATHELGEANTYKEIRHAGVCLKIEIEEFLIKYASKLTPKERYIANNDRYKAFGYKERGLLFGFAHSIPDATLPIFWSPGINNWEPLIERR